jgi:hypothetical protein
MELERGADRSLGVEKRLRRGTSPGVRAHDQRVTIYGVFMSGAAGIQRFHGELEMLWDNYGFEAFSDCQAI